MENKNDFIYLTDEEQQKLSDEEAIDYIYRLSIHEEERRKREEDIYNQEIKQAILDSEKSKIEAEKKANEEKEEKSLYNFLGNKPELRNFRFRLIRVGGSGYCLFNSLSKITNLNSTEQDGIRLRDELHLAMTRKEIEYITPIAYLDHDEILLNELIDSVKEVLNEMKNQEEKYNPIDKIFANSININDYERINDFNTWIQLYGLLMIPKISRWGSKIDYTLYAMLKNINIKVIRYNSNNNQCDDDFMTPIIIDDTKEIHYLRNIDGNHFDYIYVYQECANCHKENNNIANYCTQCGTPLPHLENTINNQNRNKYLKYKNKYLKLKKLLKK